jgi:hypothetical protein
MSGSVCLKELEGDGGFGGLGAVGFGRVCAAQTISNEEIVASFNAYVHRYNRDHA